VISPASGNTIDHHRNPGQWFIGCIMLEYDLGVAWNWQFDADFIALLDARCQSKGLSMLQITPGNLGEILHSRQSGNILPRF
jgi:hypothetical protein